MASRIFKRSFAQALIKTHQLEYAIKVARKSCKVVSYNTEGGGPPAGLFPVKAAPKRKVVLPTPKDRFLSSRPPKSMLSRRWCSTTTVPRRFSGYSNSVRGASLNQSNSLSQALFQMSGNDRHTKNPFLTREELKTSNELLLSWAPLWSPGRMDKVWP